jgi:hypothetical protein
MDALKKVISDNVSDFVLKTDDGKEKTPKVCMQYLEEKKASRMKNAPVDDTDDYPSIIIRFLEERETGDDTVAEFRIIAGIYCSDVQQGYRDVLNILNRIKIALKKKQNIVSFRLKKGSYSTSIPEEQETPYWIGYSNVQYVVPEIQDEEVLQCLTQ